MAAPFSAATVGSRYRSTISNQSMISRMKSAPAAASAGMVLRSPPAQKAEPRPVMTTARRSCARNRSSAARTPVRTTDDSALREAGSSSSIRPIESTVRVRTPVIGPLPESEHSVP